MKQLGIALMLGGLGIMALLWGGQSPSLGEDPSSGTSDLLYTGGVWAGLIVALIGGGVMTLTRKRRPPTIVS